MPSTSLFKSGPIAGKSVSHGPTFAGEQWISTGASAFFIVFKERLGINSFNF